MRFDSDVGFVNLWPAYLYELFNVVAHDFKSSPFLTRNSFTVLESVNKVAVSSVNNLANYSR